VFAPETAQRMDSCAVVTFAENGTLTGP
jgi:hypothetical protein